MNENKLKAEINEAYITRQSRAAFGSILRRHIEQIVRMSSDERAKFVSVLGLPASYTVEISKELSVWKYDKQRRTA